MIKMHGQMIESYELSGGSYIEGIQEVLVSAKFAIATNAEIVYPNLRWVNQCHIPL